MINVIEQLLLAEEYQAASILINKLIESKSDLAGRHITYANSILLGCDWDRLTSIMPKNTNTLITSGWLNSLKQRRPVNLTNQPIPWLTYPAIDFLDSIVKKDWKVFEWGSGNSTLWWAERVSSVTAIEDDTDWYNEIKAQMPTNVRLLNITGQEEYSNAMSLGESEQFDVIVIDGSFRNECAIKCVERLSNSGIIIFDNSDGNEYDSSMSLLNECGFIRNDYWGLIPSYMYKNCTSIFYKDTSFLKNLPPPSQHVSSVGISCFQAIADERP